MKVVLFSKCLRGADIRGLIAHGQALGIDGYELCVRPGHPVGPDNLDALPAAVAALRAEKLDVPLIAAPMDLFRADDPRAEPYCRAVASAGVGLLKIGYVHFPQDRDYWAEVDRMRREFAGWERLAARLGVTVIYHTHAGDMGQNASALAHVIRGFDPRHVAGYLDPGHMLYGGEPFPLAAAITGEQLRAVGLKDADFRARRFVPAGAGDVDWAAVFTTLAARGFDGPLSVHADYEVPKGMDLATLLPQEIAFFRGWRDRSARGQASHAAGSD